ncbi:unnamed protein product [Parascedosporium putredinis]|uniref:Uncharacterized protein n=1 Tax=Parascedosporium putredinis TaxID=1442378 RepID=A0A9P1HBE8_9PEZI|nr:unnamed protein product [Parascedosporium putredinis]CAI8002052.1 unnamed protein product [Parascedosporium putredinis]
MDKVERPIRVNPATKNLLLEAGYVDVEEKVVKIYHNPWNRGGHAEQTGRWFNLGLTFGLEGLSLAPLTRILGMRESEVKELVDKVRHETCLLRHHGYCNLHIWTARRPAEYTGPTGQSAGSAGGSNQVNDNSKGGSSNAKSSPIATGSTSGSGKNSQ